MEDESKVALLFLPGQMLVGTMVSKEGDALVLKDVLAYDEGIGPQTRMPVGQLRPYPLTTQVGAIAFPPVPYSLDLDERFVRAYQDAIVQLRAKLAGIEMASVVPPSNAKVALK